MEKILVIQTAFIGDAILTLPMIQKLKEKFSESEIHVLCIPDTKDIFGASPVVDYSIIIEKKKRHRSLFSLLKFISEIKKEKFTQIYSPHRSIRSSLIVKLSGVKNTFGFSNCSLSFLYKNLIQYDKFAHEVQRNLKLAGFSYNNHSWKIKPELNLSGISVQALEEIFVNYNAGSKIYAIAPGSVWNTKKYPAEYFESIISSLVAENKFVLLLGGEKDKDLCKKLAVKFDKGVISIAGKISLLQSAALLKKCEILISNDSAPTHLGIAAGIPVLTIYCSTIPAFGFYPYMEGSSFISFDELNCKPCGIHGHENCPIGTFECGLKLKPESVILKIKEMLNVRN